MGLFFLSILCITDTLAAAGFSGSLSRDLARLVLSETSPSLFNRNELRAEDFSIEWVGTPLPNVQPSIIEGSIQWVYIAELIALPRARVLITAKGVDSGQVTNAGFTLPFDIRDRNGQAEVPVALISGERNLIEVSLGNHSKGTLQIRYKPRLSKRIGDQPVLNSYFDTTCSPFKVQVAEAKLQSSDNWMYVSCRPVYVKTRGYTTVSLEMYVFWDNVGQTIKVNDIDTNSTSSSLWQFRLKHGQKLALQAGQNSVRLSYAVRDRNHDGAIALGLGPYSYIFQAQGADTHSVIPLITLYGSFFVNDTIRIVAFDATAIHKNYYTDFGLYLSTISVKALDNRLTVNLMLGAHALAFSVADTFFLKPSAPQGLEFAYRDALKTGFNLALGAFVYPLISGRAYNNIWARWGTSKFFGELNYISWREKIGDIDDQSVYSRSLGLSFGFPLFNFL